MGMSDIECTSNPCNNSGNLLTVFTVTNNGGVPSLSAPDSITVPGYTVPPSAPQKGTINVLDTLDGRITRAVSAVDPRFGSTIFPSIVVLSKIGAGSQTGTLVHSSTTNDHDFTCVPGPCRWGDYGGATPDPAASQTGSHGEVWLSNMYTNGGSIFSGGDLSWN